jgi:hypothetical protein
MMEKDTEKNIPDYLEKVFRAIAEADKEMNKYGIYLSWQFKLLPYQEMVTRSFIE